VVFLSVVLLLEKKELLIVKLKIWKEASEPNYEFIIYKSKKKKKKIKKEESLESLEKSLLSEMLVVVMEMLLWVARLGASLLRRPWPRR